MSIFGPIIDANQVEEAARNTLRDWFQTYLNEFALQRSIPLDRLPYPRSFILTGDNEKEPEDQLPAIAIVSPGLADEPLQEGDGSFRSNWSLGVGIFISAIDRESTERVVRWYCAIIRAIMLQRQSLGGFSDGVRWLDEGYDELEFDDERTIGAGLVEFEVEVAGVVNKRMGPAYPDPPDPDEQPGSNWPIVDEVIVDEEILEEV